MKFMVTWKIPPGNHKAATESFLSGGAPVPPELKTNRSLACTGFSHGMASD